MLKEARRRKLGLVSCADALAECSELRLRLRRALQPKPSVNYESWFHGKHVKWPSDAARGTQHGNRDAPTGFAAMVRRLTHCVTNFPQIGHHCRLLWLMVQVPQSLHLIECGSCG